MTQMTQMMFTFASPCRRSALYALRSTFCVPAWGFLLACVALLAPAARPAPFTVEQLAFFDAEHGWALGSRCAGGRCAAELRETVDGGATWQLRDLPEPLRQPGGSGRHAATLAFSGPSAGWIYGPGLYATHDAGQTWERVPTDGAILALATAGRAVWRIEASRATAGQPPRAALRVSPDGGRTWGPARPSPGPPPDGSTPDRIPPLDVRSAFLDAGPPGELAVLRTGDGGRTWRRLVQPCQAHTLTASLASRAGRLWLLCAGDPAAGGQAKQLYRSDDGGRAWRLLSDSADRGPGGLPELGYSGAPVALSPTRLIVAQSRGAPLASDDAGRTWRAAIPDERFATRHAGPLTFTDDRHGWAAVDDTVYRTADGGRTWARADIR